MKTHEYQAKQILRISGVKVPRGILATSPLEAEDAARQLGCDVLMVKAQIHAGGRGKAGGVKVARSPTDAGNIAERILGTRLWNPAARGAVVVEGTRLASRELDATVNRLADALLREGRHRGELRVPEELPTVRDRS